MIIKDVYNSKTQRKAFSSLLNHSIAGYLSSNKQIKILKFDSLQWWYKYGGYWYFHRPLIRKEIGSYFRGMCQYLSKCKIYVPFDPTIPLLGIYSIDILTRAHKRQFIVPLFAIIPY